MIIETFEQYSDEYWAAKIGKPSASNTDKLITPTGKPTTQREGYLYEIVAERITGQRTETYTNDAMEEGTRREDESRKLFEVMHDVTVEQVGLVWRDEKKEVLCSPDGLVREGDKYIYGLELKNVLPKTQVGYLLSKKVPPKYMLQVQFSMWVTELPVWYFLSYSPGLDPFCVKVPRDTELINKIQAEVLSFCKDADRLTEQLKRR
jgi:predicted phage-related endonuclease